MYRKVMSPEGGGEEEGGAVDLGAQVVCLTSSAGGCPERLLCEGEGAGGVGGGDS